MNIQDIQIKETTRNDLEHILNVESLAFAGEEEILTLVSDLFNDNTAEPYLSLLALYNEEPIGHILFTRAYLNNNNKPLIHILAPLAVNPEFQNKGVGGMLVKRGLETLKERGTEFVFVLGHITYYPKYGFINDAGKLGFEAPYPIPEEVADAWMVQEIIPGVLDKYNGKIKCANAMMKPEYWRE